MKSVSEKVAPAKRRPAVEIEEVPDEGDSSYEKPRNSQNVLEAADGSDDEFGAPLPEVISFDTDTDEEVSPKIVENDEEDDEADLSMYLYSVGSLVDFKFFSARMSKMQWVRTLPYFCTISHRCNDVVLHPQHKLEYFRNAGWEQEWINGAEKIVRAEYKRSYKYAEHLQAALKPAQVRRYLYFNPIPYFDKLYS